MPIAIEVGDTQGPSPGSKRFWDQGVRPGANAALHAARRGPILGALQRLCPRFPSHLRGGKIEAQSGERA